MSFETVELNQQGPVSILSLNRHDKLNAINRSMLLELNAALGEVEKNDSAYDQPSGCRFSGAPGDS